MNDSPDRIPRPIVRALRASEVQRRCPLTMQLLREGESIAECGDCHALHSFTAWRENEGCATFACRCAPNFRRDHPELVLRVGTLQGDPLPPQIRRSSQPDMPWPTERIVVRIDAAPRAAPRQHIPPPPPPFPPSSGRVINGWSPPPPPPFPPSSGRVINGWSPPPPPPFQSAPVPAGKMGKRRVISSDEPTMHCPYSMEALSVGTAVVECHVCGQVLLVSAWDENGGCTTYGCEGAPDFRKDIQ